MKNLIIEEEGRGVVEVFQEIPDSMRKYLSADAVAGAIHGDRFHALFEAFPGNGFSAYHSHYWMQQPVVLRAKGSKSILELRIALRSMLHGTWDKISVAALPENHFQMGFTPHIITRAIFDSSPVYEMFDIHFELAYLTSLGLNYKQLDRFINSIQINRQAELSAYPHHCTPRMMDHVMGVLHNHYSAEGKAAFLQQAVNIILFEALEEVCRLEAKLPTLTRKNIDQVQEVKRIIESDCPEYCGNDALCKAVGINEFYLHVWFKEVFGETPREYYLHLRFMQAKKLLLQGDSAVQVAYELGYKGAAAFGTEFKKHFGYTPKQFQKGKV